MEKSKPQRLDCAHCGSTGTCNNGPDGSSCAVCIKKHKIENQSSEGLVCSVCGGIGTAEPFTDKLHSRVVPALALLIVYVALYLIFMFGSKENFNEILAFASTLIGSVTGYYFGGKKKN